MLLYIINDKKKKLMEPELHIIFIFCHINVKSCGKISIVNLSFVHISTNFINCKVIRFHKIRQ